MTKVIEGTLIALPIRWEGTRSQCVEWKLVDWTVPDDNGERLPIWFDGGDTGAWGSDYAIRGPLDTDWRFPDGETCNDVGLVAAFMQRAGTTLKEYKPNRAERHVLKRQRAQIEKIEETCEVLEAEGKLSSVTDADGVKRWLVPKRLQ